LGDLGFGEGQFLVDEVLLEWVGEGDCEEEEEHDPEEGKVWEHWSEGVEEDDDSSWLDQSSVVAWLDGFLVLGKESIDGGVDADYPVLNSLRWDILKFFGAFISLRDLALSKPDEEIESNTSNTDEQGEEGDQAQQRVWTETEEEQVSSKEDDSSVFLVFPGEKIRWADGSTGARFHNFLIF